MEEEIKEENNECHRPMWKIRGECINELRKKHYIIIPKELIILDVDDFVIGEEDEEDWNKCLNDIDEFYQTIAMNLKPSIQVKALSHYTIWVDSSKTVAQMVEELESEHKVFSSRGYQIDDPDQLEIIYREFLGNMKDQSVISEIVKKQTAGIELPPKEEDDEDEDEEKDLWEKGEIFICRVPGLHTIDVPLADNQVGLMMMVAVKEQEKLLKEGKVSKADLIKQVEELLALNQQLHPFIKPIEGYHDLEIPALA